MGADESLRGRRWYETMNGLDVQSKILLFSGSSLLRSSYNQISTSHRLGTPLPLAESVSWGNSPCVDVSSDEVPPSCCTIFISIDKLILSIKLTTIRKVGGRVRDNEHYDSRSNRSEQY